MDQPWLTAVPCDIVLPPDAARAVQGALVELFEIGVIGCASFDQMSNILHDQYVELNQKLTPKTLFSLESLAPILRTVLFPYQISSWLSPGQLLERCSTLALRFSSIASCGFIGDPPHVRHQLRIFAATGGDYGGVPPRS